MPNSKYIQADVPNMQYIYRLGKPYSLELKFFFVKSLHKIETPLFPDYEVPIYLFSMKNSEFLHEVRSGGYFL